MVHAHQGRLHELPTAEPGRDRDTTSWLVKKTRPLKGRVGYALILSANSAAFRVFHPLGVCTRGARTANRNMVVTKGVWP